MNTNDSPIARQEFINGEIFTLTPESDSHDRLVHRLATLLEADAGLRRCTVFSTTTKIEVIPDVCYLYADIAVTCNMLEFRNTNSLMRQPRILVEVSSAQTRERDRSFKWQQYQQIPSLQYFLLVDQETVAVDLFSRNEATRQWHQQTYNSVSDVMVLPRFEMAILLKSIYNA